MLRHLPSKENNLKKYTGDEVTTKSPRTLPFIVNASLPPRVTPSPRGVRGYPLARRSHVTRLRYARKYLRSQLFRNYSFRNDSKETCLNGESLDDIESFCTNLNPSDRVTGIHQDNPVLNHSFNTFPALPGIYMILCKPNDWRYYGETTNLQARRSSHKSLLKRNIHPNRNLQNDLNHFGLEAFEFSVLYSGKSWEEKSTRCRKEESLILSDIDRTYNIYKENAPKGTLNPFYSRFHSEESKKQMSESSQNVPNILLGRPIEIPSFKTRTKRVVPGGRFPSITEASRQTGLSRQMIRSRINSDEYSDWKLLLEENSNNSSLSKDKKNENV